MAAKKLIFMKQRGRSYYKNQTRQKLNTNLRNPIAIIPVSNFLYINCILDHVSSYRLGFLKQICSILRKLKSMINRVIGTWGDICLHPHQQNWCTGEKSCGQIGRISAVISVGSVWNLYIWQEISQVECLQILQICSVLEDSFHSAGIQIKSLKFST